MDRRQLTPIPPRSPYADLPPGGIAIEAPDVHGPVGRWAMFVLEFVQAIGAVSGGTPPSPVGALLGYLDVGSRIRPPFWHLMNIAVDPSHRPSWDRLGAAGAG